MRKLKKEEAQALGAALRQAREDAGLSREALARDVGISSSSVQHYEQGGSRSRKTWIVAAPSAPTLSLIADCLGTSGGEILEAAGLAPDLLPSGRAPIGREERATFAAIARTSDNAAAVNLRISVMREEWIAFLESLPTEAKGSLLMMMANGNVVTT